MRDTLDQRLDRVAAVATRAADRSKIWLLTAAALALAGGPQGRRAAARGVMSIGLASLVANAILKPILQRTRPAARGPAVVPRPKSFSFPSGHTASAFAFATAVGSEMPRLAFPLLLAAAAVAYSRVRGGVHYVSDVLAGAAVGVAAGLVTQPVASRLSDRVEDAVHPPRPYRAVLVVSPHAGRAAQKLDRARAALAAHGADIVETIPVTEVDRVINSVAARGATHVVAAGGDGTVGAVADRIANSEAVLVVMPLGTSNDFARSLGIPMRLDDAAALVSRGRVSSIDIGRMDAPGRPPRRFVHAATAGLNVNFAKLATRASLRKRFGRLTYAVAAAFAVRDVEPFDCALTHGGTEERVAATQVSIINAPVFGGFLGLRVIGSNVNDGLLDVLVAEALPAWRTMLAGLYQLVRLRRPLKGVRPFRAATLSVDAGAGHEVSLDGEIAGELPAVFTAEPATLRVVVPRTR